jgi:hypothetical protein
MPARSKTLPTWTAMAVRVVMRLPSFAMVASWRRSRSRSRSAHSMARPWRWHRSVSSDGLFVLRTNARITPLQAVLRYRDLLQVEDLFRRAKAILRTRPIYHSSDAAIRGHVFCSRRSSSRSLMQRGASAPAAAGAISSPSHAAAPHQSAAQSLGAVLPLDPPIQSPRASYHISSK